MRPDLEKTLLEIENRRQEYERKERYRKRLAELPNWYKSYMKEITPSQWASLPPVSALANFSQVEDILNSSSDAEPKEDIFAPLLFHMPDITSEWTEAQRLKLCQTLVPNALNRILADVDCGEDDRKKALDALNFDLATIVFMCGCKSLCTRDYPVFGVTEGSRYRCVSGRPIDRTLDMFASRAAGRLVRDAGLDPCTVTGEDMDSKDARFICSTCSPTPNTRLNRDGTKIALGYVVYTWRQAVRMSAPTKHEGSHLDPGSSRNVGSPRRTSKPIPYFNTLRVELSNSRF
jgi:hypothetical protein